MLFVILMSIFDEPFEIFCFAMKICIPTELVDNGSIETAQFLDSGAVNCHKASGFNVSMTIWTTIENGNLCFVVKNY